MDCKFENNVAQWGGGLFVDFQDNAHSNSINVSGCEFTGNHCPYFIREGMQGGGMRVGHYVYGLDDPIPTTATGNAITIEHCNFTNNSALHGGGLAVSLALQIAPPDHIAFVKLLNSSFESNIAKVGSAVYFYRFSSTLKGFVANVQIENCSFSHNTVDYAEIIGRGKSPYQTGIGAVHVDEVPVWFKGSLVFHHNTGSALSVIGAVVNFTYCQARFSENHGNKGAAIALLGTAYMQVSNNTLMAFEHNTATNRGGAIYNTYISQETLKSDSNCFIRHTNPFLHPDDWNATFIFRSNTDLGGNHLNAIHSTSVLPCLLPGGSGLSNKTSQVFCWKNWLYNSQHFARVTSDIGKITFIDDRYISIYSGWEFALPIELEDDLKHRIEDASFQVTYNDTHGVNVYRSDAVVVRGEPDEAVETVLEIEYGTLT